MGRRCARLRRAAERGIVAKTMRGIANGVEEQRSWGGRFRKRLERDENRVARGLIRRTNLIDYGRFAQGDGRAYSGGNANVEHW